MKSPRKFKLEFATDNAAFEQYPYEEAAAICRGVAAELMALCTAGPIRDLNGNRIGQWSLK
jgi:hypothetical protein